MEFIEKIKRYFSKRVIFLTIGAVTRVLSGEKRMRNSHDWAFRYGIISAIHRYMPKRVYIISNEDVLSPFDERDLVNKYEAVTGVLRACTKAKVDYMFNRSRDKENPLRMPNTGMVDYFSHQHIGEEFDKREILFVGDSKEAKECAARIGCRYLGYWDFIEEYKQK